MKIIWSPTKSMKRKDFKLNKTEVLFKTQCSEIREILKSKSMEDLKKLYKVSDKLVSNSYQFLHEEKECISALNLYDGLVFKQLQMSDYDQKDFSYLEEHVMILSALYGALRVSDQINEYRLDYFMNFDVDLYDYWEEPLTQYFKNEALIINLASSEFSKSFKHPNMVNVIFENQEGKTLSTAAKMARGDMLNYFVQEKIVDIEGVKRYNNLNYQFNKEKSDDRNLYFVMEEV